MAVPKTSLSAGEIIRTLLLENAEVATRVNKIFPVYTNEAILPYIAYRRAGFSSNPQKSGQPGADEIQMEILCYTQRYSDGVELAEAVRTTLDYATAPSGPHRLRACYLTGCEEAYQDDAYIQQLIFTIKL